MAVDRGRLLERTGNRHGTGGGDSVLGNRPTSGRERPRSSERAGSRRHNGKDRAVSVTYMRRTTGLVLLLSAVLLAGCGSPGDAHADERRTLTPVPVPTGDAPTGVGVARVAPGLTADALVDPEALLRSHAARLDNTSYTSRRRVTRRYRNGSLRSRWNSTVRDNGTAARIRHSGIVVREGAETVTRIDRWSTDDRIYMAVTHGNDTTYQVSPVVDAGRGTFDGSDYSESLGRILTHLPVTVGDPVEVNGTTVYPLAVAEPRDVPPLRNVSFSGHVTRDGVLMEYTLRYGVRNDGVPVRVTVHTVISNVGRTTVERPGWVADAVNATS